MAPKTDQVSLDATLSKCMLAPQNLSFTSLLTNKSLRFSIVSHFTLAVCCML